MNQELRAALEAAMANPRLAKKVAEVLELSQSESVADLDSGATLPEAVIAINAILAALKDAKLMAE